MELFHGNEYAIVLVNKDGHYMNFVDELTIKGLDSVSTPIPPIKQYEGEELYQGTVFILPEHDEEFSAKLPVGCKLARWGSHGADIIAKEGGKAVGMQFFSELLGILPEEMMAFGDAKNDMDMIEYAGLGIAMGNSEKCLKEIANDITTDVDDDGILNALVKYGVLDASCLM